jgi:hypothetical protein
MRVFAPHFLYFSKFGVYLKKDLFYENEMEFRIVRGLALI